MPFDESSLTELEAIVGQAAKIAQDRQKLAKVMDKEDGSLVTEADQEVERFLRDQLADKVPGAAFWGEEFGYQKPGPGGLWLLDPIDGTSNYAYGQPLWGVTVALAHEGKLAAGIVVLPALGWSFRALRGRGAWCNGEPMSPVVKGCVKPNDLVGRSDEKHDPFHDLPGKRRHFGSFVVESMFVAQGMFRAMTSSRVKLYDAAGSLVVLREVGIEVRTKSGDLFDESQWLRDVRCDPFVMAPPGAWPIG